MKQMKYVPRGLEKFVQRAAKQFPVLLVTGARQVGKTTFLQHLSEPKRTYVTLDDPRVLQLAKTDPALFFQRYPPPILLDEIQYAPELLPFIKMAVDQQASRNQFWLTGSQQFHLMKGVAESLAGRVAIVHLSGFSRRERLEGTQGSPPFLPTARVVTKRLKTGGRLTLKELYALIWRGSFPALVLHPKADRDLFFSSYVQTYLQRDIRDLARVGDGMAFLRFLRGTAARTGQLLNLADLARDAGVAFNTAKSWLSILEASGLIFLLEPYFNNVSKRFIKTPKLYFLDTGLCAYLTEWTSPENLEAGAMSGAILETWVMGEILKGFWQAGSRPPVFFYRDKDAKEIDFLVVRDGIIYPLECKKTASPRLEDARHFKSLKPASLQVGEGGVICLINEFLPLSASVHAIPVSAL
jgi:hypothetical protein